MITLLMYLVMVCEVTFPAVRDRQEVVIRKVQEISGEKSWKNLTDTALIKVASKQYFQNKKVALKDFIKRGDPVIIKVGYGNTYNTEMTGFVSHVSPKIPVEISCEGFMYKLKNHPANFSYKAVRLPQMLKDICPSDITVDAIDIELGAFLATKTNVAKVLDKIKEQFGVVAYFKNNTLRVGKVYFSNPGRVPVATVNLRRNCKSNDLVYKEKDEVKLKVKAISNLTNGKKIEVEVGDEDGESRTLNYYGITDENTLKASAERDMEKLKVEGYRGSVKLYGIPFIEHTDVITLEDPLYPEKNGNYFVDTIKWMFSSTGYERTADIGAKAN